MVLVLSSRNKLYILIVRAAGDGSGWLLVHYVHISISAYWFFGSLGSFLFVYLLLWLIANYIFLSHRSHAYFIGLFQCWGYERGLCWPGTSGCEVSAVLKNSVIVDSTHQLNFFFLNWYRVCLESGVKHLFLTGCIEKSRRLLCMLQVSGIGSPSDKSFLRR